jgi:hypothetical protein
MSNTDGKRLRDMVRFYSIVDRLEVEIGDAWKLTDCSGRMSWPKRGVYFFRETGENRILLHPNLPFACPYRTSPVTYYIAMP